MKDYDALTIPWVLLPSHSMMSEWSRLGPSFCFYGDVLQLRLLQVGFVTAYEPLEAETCEKCGFLGRSVVSSHVVKVTY